MPQSNCPKEFKAANYHATDGAVVWLRESLDHLQKPRKVQRNETVHPPVLNSVHISTHPYRPLGTTRFPESSTTVPTTNSALEHNITQQPQHGGYNNKRPSLGRRYTVQKVERRVFGLSGEMPPYSEDEKAAHPSESLEKPRTRRSPVQDVPPEDSALCVPKTTSDVCGLAIPARRRADEDRYRPPTTAERPALPLRGLPTLQTVTRVESGRGTRTPFFLTKTAPQPPVAILPNGRSPADVHLNSVPHPSERGRVKLHHTGIGTSKICKHVSQHAILSTGPPEKSFNNQKRGSGLFAVAAEGGAKPVTTGTVNYFRGRCEPIAERSNIRVLAQPTSTLSRFGCPVSIQPQVWHRPSNGALSDAAFSFGDDTVCEIEFDATAPEPQKEPHVPVSSCTDRATPVCRTFRPYQETDCLHVQPRVRTLLKRQHHAIISSITRSHTTQKPVFPTVPKVSLDRAVASVHISPATTTESSVRNLQSSTRPLSRVTLSRVHSNISAVQPKSGASHRSSTSSHVQTTTQRRPMIIMCEVPATGEALLKKQSPLRAPHRHSIIPRKPPRPAVTGFDRDNPSSRYHRYVEQFELQQRDRMKQRNEATQQHLPPHSTNFSKSGLPYNAETRLSGSTEPATENVMFDDHPAHAPLSPQVVIDLVDDDGPTVTLDASAPLKPDDRDSSGTELSANSHLQQHEQQLALGSPQRYAFLPQTTDVKNSEACTTHKNSVSAPMDLTAGIHNSRGFDKNTLESLQSSQTTNIMMSKPPGPQALQPESDNDAFLIQYKQSPVIYYFKLSSFARLNSSAVGTQTCWWLWDLLADQNAWAESCSRVRETLLLFRQPVEPHFFQRMLLPKVMLLLSDFVDHFEKRATQFLEESSGMCEPSKLERAHREKTIITTVGGFLVPLYGFCISFYKPRNGPLSAQYIKLTNYMLPEFKAKRQKHRAVRRAVLETEFTSASGASVRDVTRLWAEGCYKKFDEVVSSARSDSRFLASNSTAPTRAPSVSKSFAVSNALSRQKLERRKRAALQVIECWRAAQNALSERAKTLQDSTSAQTLLSLTEDEELRAMDAAIKPTDGSIHCSDVLNVLDRSPMVEKENTLVNVALQPHQKALQHLKTTVSDTQRNVLRIDRERDVIQNLYFDAVFKKLCIRLRKQTQKMTERCKEAQRDLLRRSFGLAPSFDLSRDHVDAHSHQHTKSATLTPSPSKAFQSTGSEDDEDFLRSGGRFSCYTPTAWSPLTDRNSAVRMTRVSLSCLRPSLALSEHLNSHFPPESIDKPLSNKKPQSSVRLSLLSIQSLEDVSPFRRQSSLGLKNLKAVSAGSCPQAPCASPTPNMPKRVPLNDVSFYPPLSSTCKSADTLTNSGPTTRISTAVPTPSLWEKPLAEASPITGLLEAAQRRRRTTINYTLRLKKRRNPTDTDMLHAQTDSG